MNSLSRCGTLSVAICFGTTKHLPWAVGKGSTNMIFTWYLELELVQYITGHIEVYMSLGDIA